MRRSNYGTTPRQPARRLASRYLIPGYLYCFGGRFVTSGYFHRWAVLSTPDRQGRPWDLQGTRQTSIQEPAPKIHTPAWQLPHTPGIESCNIDSSGSWQFPHTVHAQTGSVLPADNNASSAGPFLQTTHTPEHEETGQYPQYSHHKCSQDDAYCLT